MQDSSDPEGLRVFYYLVQDLKALVFSLISLHFKASWLTPNPAEIVTYSVHRSNLFEQILWHGVWRSYGILRQRAGLGRKDKEHGLTSTYTRGTWTQTSQGQAKQISVEPIRSRARKEAALSCPVRLAHDAGPGLQCQMFFPAARSPVEPPARAISETQQGQHRRHQPDPPTHQSPSPAQSVGPGDS